LSIDPQTGEVTGTVTLGSSAGGPYTVTVTADDGHGGTVSLTFDWEVIMPPTPMPNPQPNPVPLPPLDSGPAVVTEDVILQTVNSLDPLNGTPALADYVITRTVEGLGSLNAATDPGSGGDVITRLVAWAGRQGRSAGWMHQLLDDLAHQPYAGDSIALALSIGDRDVLTVRTLIRDGALFVGVDDLGGEIRVTGIRGPHGHALPNHVAVVDPQTLVVNIRPDRHPLLLSIEAVDRKGRTLSWPLEIDPTSAEVSPAGRGDRIAAVIEDMRTQIGRIARDEGPPLKVAVAAE
jgi:hypothetical protein